VLNHFTGGNMFNIARITTLTAVTALLALATTIAAEMAAPAQHAASAGQQMISQDSKGAPQKPEQQIDLQKVSEAFGHFIGRNLKTPGVNFDLDQVIKGMREGAAGKPAPMSDKEYEQMMSAIQENAFKVLSQENLKAANEFLAKNKGETGVVEIEPTKLQYKVEKQGSGDVVGPHSSPQIQYTGKFIDGTVFNSSTEAGGPVTIALDQTIKGFSLGIAGMKEGEKRRLFIHPDFGYGTSGHFPPNSLLIFDVEVVKAQSPEQSYNEDADDDLSPLSLMSDNDGDDDGDDNDDDDDDDSDRDL